MSAILGLGPVQTLGLGTAGAVAAPFADPLLSTVSRFANSITLTAIPGPAELIALHGANLLSRTALRQALRWHGVLLGDYGVQGTFQNSLWNAVLEGHRAVPGIDQLMSGWAKGYLSDQSWQLGIMRAGGSPQTWERLLPAYYAVPTVQDLMVARNRGIVTPAEFSQQLRRHGFVLPSDQSLVDALRLQLPTPSELIQWVVREAFDTDVVTRWGYDQEVPEAARPLFEAQGLFGQYTRVGTSTGQTQTVGHLDQTWAAHWLPLSPGQAYTMLHRVREDNIGRFTSRGLNVKPFTVDDVRSWLKIADYPPGVRDYLIATSYGVNRLIDIRNALRLGVRDRAWAVSQFRDRGLHPDDAEFAADLAERQAYETRNATVRAIEKTAVKVTIDAIRHAYEVGYLDRQQAFDNLTNAGLAWTTADTLLVGIDAAVYTGLVKRAISAVKRDYLGGAIDSQGAVQALTTAGIQGPQIDRYVRVWSVELGHARRVASTQQVRDWYLEGLMTLEEAQRRLRNLGWAEPDVQLHLVSYLQKAGQAQAKRAAAAQKSQRAQAAEIEKLQKQLAAEQERNRATLRRLSPVGKLQAWYVKGIIGEDFFRRRMAAMGYDLGSTNQHFEEARQKKGEADAAAEKKRQAAEAPPEGA